MAKSNSTSLLRPGNALSALGIQLLKWSAKLPMSTLQAIGRTMGNIAYYLVPYRRHVADTNIRLCFPNMPEKERNRLVRQNYQAMAIGIFELAAAWYKDDSAIRDMSEIVGLEHLDAVTQSGRGALLTACHTSCMEMTGRILLLNRKFGCLYRKPDQPIIAREMMQRRDGSMDSVIHMDEIKTLIRALRSGRLVWYTPDQGRKIKYSEVLPFFGEPAVTNTATGRIARMANAAVVPLSGYRLPNGRYKVEIHPELKEIPAKDPTTDGLILNRTVEQMVLKAPEQYFWLHKRFKRRGPGFPDVYARKSRRK